MTKAYYSSVLNYSIDHVWQMIRDFNDYPRYIEGVTDSAIEDDKGGDEVGAVRRFRYNGSWIRQRLAAHSDTEHAFSYAGMDPFRFPMQGTANAPEAIDYTGTVRLMPVTDGGRTFIEWFVEFDSSSGDSPKWDELLTQNLIPE